MPSIGEISGRPLGPRGPRLFPVGFGTMALSLWRRPDPDVALGVILAAIDAGAQLLDTADAYCLDGSEHGYGERLVAAALRLRPGVLVATKGGFTRPGGRWQLDGSPAHLHAACEASLRALGVATIDLYQLHRPDGRIPFADSVGALAELREAGKIRRVGLSNVNAEQLAQALDIVPIASVQNRLSPFCVDPLCDGVLRLCEARGVAFLAYSPLGGLRRSAEIATLPALATLAPAYGATAHQLALSWLLGCSPAILVLPSASGAARAVENVAAARICLSAADRSALDAAFLPSKTRCDGDGACP